jgi:DNA polymerase
MKMTREDVLRELELLPIWTIHPSQSDATTIVTTVTSSAVSVEEHATEPVELGVATQHAQTATTPVTVKPVTLEKIAVKWLLYCPLDPALDQDALTLLGNMVRAMQLLTTDYQLVHQAEALLRFQPAHMLLFGLDAGHAVLGKVLTYEETKEQPYLHAECACWVLHHPKDLMQDPSLKREAWHIMCAAKAYAQQL